MVKALFLRGALPYPYRLRSGAAILRIYQRWGIRALVHKSGLLKLLPGNMADLEAGLPSFSRRFFGPAPHIFPSTTLRAGSAICEARACPERSRGMKVGLLSGCVMPLVQGPTMEAAVRVLTRNSCDVAVPLGQGCCGALNLHSGDVEMARKMARCNIDTFLNAGVEKIVVASAGCGSAMKEYHDLLRDDPQYKEAAERFSGMTADITEFLVDLPFDPPKGEIRGRITYQDPCHLAHAQRITQAPRAILKSIPGLDFVEMENSSRCCGAAGIYSVTQRRLSRRLLESKMGSVAATGAETVATANPGCLIQLETGLRLAGIPGKVCHVVDILDESYQREE